MDLLLATLLYPGLALALGLTLLLLWLTDGRMPARLSAMFWRSADGLAALGSIALASLALALLPWPFHPAAGWRWIGHPVALWAALEGAFLAPILPGLLAPATLAARAASRETQMSLAGRCVFWLALGAALWSGASWGPSALPGRVLILLAGLLVFPAAAGLGPFVAERSLSNAAAEEGLDEGAAGLVRFARAVRGAALLATLALASLPLTMIQPWPALLLALALFAVAAVVLRRLAATQPRLTLPAALRWCWWRALPLAVAGLVLLTMV